MRPPETQIDQAKSAGHREPIPRPIVLILSENGGGTLMGVDQGTDKIDKK